MKRDALPLLLAALLLILLLLFARQPAGATVQWPTWTPLPTNTPRVYPTWTPVPTATSRRSATPTVTATVTRTATRTATAHVTLEMPPTLPVPTATLPSCSKPWPFTFRERVNIQAGALNLCWGLSREPMVLPQEDVLLGLGLYMHRLGCPVTEEFTILSDDDVTRIRARGFALAIIAVMEREDIPPECRDYAVIGWDGEMME